MAAAVALTLLTLAPGLPAAPAAASEAASQQAPSAAALGLTDPLLTGIAMKSSISDGGALLVAGDPTVVLLSNAYAVAYYGATPVGVLTLGDVQFLAGMAGVSLSGLAYGDRYELHGLVNGLDPASFEVARGEAWSSSEAVFDPLLPLATLRAAPAAGCLTQNPAYPANNRHNVPYGSGTNGGAQNPGAGTLSASSYNNPGGSGGDWSYFWPNPVRLGGGAARTVSATFSMSGQGWADASSGNSAGPGGAGAYIIGAVWEWNNGWTLKGHNAIGKSYVAAASPGPQPGPSPNPLGGTLTLQVRMQPGLTYYAPFYNLAYSNARNSPGAWGSANLSSSSPSLTWC